jgi:predicted RNA-binding protein with PIN domain
MQYLVDGYNLLFRLSQETEEFQKRREELIDKLVNQVESLQLPISIIFDSAYQEGDVTRTHRGQLEIIFTSQGETADDYILDLLKRSKGNKYTVFTSDKRLAWRARSLEAKTESIEHFLSWIGRQIHNKTNPKIKKTEIKRPLLKPVQKKIAPAPTDSATDLTEHYQKQFVERFHLLMEEADAAQELKREARRPVKKGSPKKAKPPKKIEVDELPPLSDYQRWLDLFEKGTSE